MSPTLQTTTRPIDAALLNAAQQKIQRAADERKMKAIDFADELSASNRSGRTSIPDPEATAAVAIGSLSYAATLQALTGRMPGNIDGDRYFEAWVNQTLGVLAQYTNPRNP